MLEADGLHDHCRGGENKSVMDRSLNLTLPEPEEFLSELD